MAKPTQSDLKWNTIDLATLTADERSLWDDMKEAYKTYTDLKENFENEIEPAMRKTFDARDADAIKFGYRFGQLSVALAPKTERKAKNAVALKR